MKHMEEETDRASQAFGNIPELYYAAVAAVPVALGQYEEWMVKHDPVTYRKDTALGFVAEALAAVYENWVEEIVWGGRLTPDNVNAVLFIGCSGRIDFTQIAEVEFTEFYEDGSSELKVRPLYDGDEEMEPK